MLFKDFFDVEFLSFLITLGVNVNHTNKEGDSPLLNIFNINNFESREYYFERMEAMINGGAYLN